MIIKFSDLWDEVQLNHADVIRFTNLIHEVFAVTTCGNTCPYELMQWNVNYLRYETDISFKDIGKTSVSVLYYCYTVADWVVWYKNVYI